MKTRWGGTVGSVGAAALAAVLGLVTACGDSDSGLECGAGTVEMGGLCVPDDDGLTCAAGTVEQDGECVPDGSVICEAGTEFNVDTGKCELAEGACGEGTVLVDGECEVIRGFEGDISEGPEYNGFGNEDSFTAPGIGETLTIDGCVTPADFDSDGLLDIDFDTWAFEVTEDALFNVRVDGTTGLSAGFAIFGADAELQRDDWQRLGVDLTSNFAERQVYLPKGGTYVLAISDSRSIFLNQPAGGQDTCYLVQLERIAIPAPTPLTAFVGLGTFTGELGNDPQFFSVAATADQQLIFDNVQSQAPGASAAMVNLVDGVYVNSGTVDGTGEVTRGVPDLASGAQLVIVVDNEFNISLNPVDVSLFVIDTESQPATGTVTATQDDDIPAFVHFTANAGDVVRFEFLGNGDFDGFDLTVFGPNLIGLFGLPCSDCSSADVYFQVQEAGTYYVAMENLDVASGETYEASFSTVTIVPTVITPGTPVSGDLITADRDCFELDVSGHDWLLFNIANGVDIVEGSFDFYDRNAAGQMDRTVPFLFGDQADEVDAFGRIFVGDARTYLVCMNDFNFHGGSETFDVVVTPRTFIDLGTVAEGADVTGNGTVGDDEEVFVLVRAAVGSDIVATTTGTGGFDPVVRTVSRVEAQGSVVNATGADEAEVVGRTADALNFLAWKVLGADVGGVDVGGDFTLSATSVDPGFDVRVEPIPAGAYRDLCTFGGQVQPLVAAGGRVEDEGLTATPIALPFAFDHFGQAVTEMTVSTNGWFTFATGYDGNAAFNLQTLPSASSPNNVVAPLWTDLDGVTICAASTADVVVVQWRGRLFGTNFVADMQAVVESDGTITFLYGPNHTLHGLQSSVGLENADGSVGFNYGRGTLTAIPGTQAVITVAP